MTEEKVCVCAEGRLQTHDFHEKYAILLDAPDNPRRFLRPRQPWEEWVCPEQIDEPNMGCCHEEVTSSHLDIPTLELNDFLFRLEKESDNSHQWELNLQIRDYVCSSIQCIVQDLTHKFPETFENSKVHTVGSIGEGTKIGLFQEFDFMIELPALSRQLRQHLANLNVSAEDLQANRMKGIMFLKERRAELLKDFILSTPKSWALHQGPPLKLTGNLSTIFTVTYRPSPDSKPINICCDIVFCFPLKRKSGSKPRCNISGRPQDKQNQYILDGFYGTKTYVFTERDRLLNSNISGSARRVYKLTKLLVGELLPPICDIRRVNLECVIPSYYLKQIILFTMNEFPKPESWREEYLGLRVAQVMSKLQNCVEKELVSGFVNPWVGIHKTLTEESSVAKQYLPILVNLLNAAAKGANSALSSLKSLRNLTTDFKQSVITDTKLFGFCHIFVNSCDVIPAFRKPYILDRSSRNMLLDYSHKHLQGIMELREEDQRLYIEYRDETFSLVHFFERFMRIGGYLDMKVWSSKFPDRWKRCYNDMLEQHIPRDVLINVAVKQPSRVERDSPTSVQDELKVYHKYMHKEAAKFQQLLDRSDKIDQRFQEIKKSLGFKERLVSGVNTMSGIPGDGQEVENPDNPIKPQPETSSVRPRGQQQYVSTGMPTVHQKDVSSATPRVDQQYISTGKPKVHQQDVSPGTPTVPLQDSSSSTRRVDQNVSPGTPRVQQKGVSLGTTKVDNQDISSDTPRASYTGSLTGALILRQGDVSSSTPTANQHDFSTGSLIHVVHQGNVSSGTPKVYQKDTSTGTAQVNQSDGQEDLSSSAPKVDQQDLSSKHTSTNTAKVVSSDTPRVHHRVVSPGAPSVDHQDTASGTQRVHQDDVSSGKQRVHQDDVTSGTQIVNRDDVPSGTPIVHQKDISSCTPRVNQKDTSSGLPKLGKQNASSEKLKVHQQDALSGNRRVYGQDISGLAKHDQRDVSTEKIGVYLQDISGLAKHDQQDASAEKSGVHQQVVLSDKVEHQSTTSGNQDVDQKEHLSENPVGHQIMTENNPTDESTSPSPFDLLRLSNGRYVLEYDIMLAEQLERDMVMCTQDTQHQ